MACEGRPKRGEELGHADIGQKSFQQSEEQIQRSSGKSMSFILKEQQGGQCGWSGENKGKE